MCFYNPQIKLRLQRMYLRSYICIGCKNAGAGNRGLKLQIKNEAKIYRRIDTEIS